MQELKFLVEHYYQIQKHRVAMDNQLYQLRQAEEDTTTIDYFADQLRDTEKDVLKYINRRVKEHDIWNKFLKDIKGIGPALGASLIVTIDVHKTKHVSSLWKYAGLTPESKRVKGQKIDWNPFLKTTCFKIGQAFVKTRGYYRDVYDEAKEGYKKKHPERIEENGKVKYNKGHIDMMARRYVVKIFLKDLWLFWRELEGLEITEPYVISHLGHDKREKGY